MRKKTNRKTKVAESISKLKDASTQTDRYVEYVPLPIIVDIKSENESSDDTDGEAFDAAESGIEVFESFKLEIDENRHHFNEQQLESPSTPPPLPSFPPPVEQVYFEEKVNIEAFHISPKNENQEKPSKPLKKSQKTTKKRKQPTEKTNTNGTKAKKTKKQKEQTERENQRKKDEKPSSSSSAQKPVECSLCKFTCKRPSKSFLDYLLII